MFVVSREITVCSVGYKRGPRTGPKTCHTRERSAVPAELRPPRVPRITVTLGVPGAEAGLPLCIKVKLGVPVSDHAPLFPEVGVKSHFSPGKGPVPTKPSPHTGLCVSHCAGHCLGTELEAPSLKRPRLLWAGGRRCGQHAGLAASGRPLETALLRACLSCRRRPAGHRCAHTVAAGFAGFRLHALMAQVHSRGRNQSRKS